MLKHDAHSRVLFDDKDQKIKIDCQYYTEGCEKVYKVEVLGYETFFIEYEGEAAAKKGSLTKKLHRLGNWLFDQIKEDKILINFFEEKLKAKIDS